MYFSITIKANKTSVKTASKSIFYKHLEALKNAGFDLDNDILISFETI